jgi:hypothetical protein
MNVISLKNGAWKFAFENVNDADIFTSRLREIAVECHNMVTEKPEDGFEDYQGDVSEIAITFDAKRRMGELGGPEIVLSEEEMAKFIRTMVLGLMTSVQGHKACKLNLEKMKKETEVLTLRKFLTVWNEAFENYVTGTPEDKEANIKIMEDVQSQWTEYEKDKQA